MEHSISNYRIDIYTFFSSTTGTFTNILDNGRSFNKFQKTEIINYALWQKEKYLENSQSMQTKQQTSKYPWDKEKIIREIRIDFWNGWQCKYNVRICENTAEAAFRGKFIASNIYIRKEKGFKTENLSFHLKELEKMANETQSKRK